MATWETLAEVRTTHTSRGRYYSLSRSVCGSGGGCCCGGGGGVSLVELFLFVLLFFVLFSGLFN